MKSYLIYFLFVICAQKISAQIFFYPDVLKKVSPSIESLLDATWNPQTLAWEWSANSLEENYFNCEENNCQTRLDTILSYTTARGDGFFAVLYTHRQDFWYWTGGNMSVAEYFKDNAANKYRLLNFTKNAGIYGHDGKVENARLSLIKIFSDIYLIASYEWYIHHGIWKDWIVFYYEGKPILNLDIAEVNMDYDSSTEDCPYQYFANFQIDTTNGILTHNSTLKSREIKDSLCTTTQYKFDTELKKFR